jgi:hypothetical protein
MGLTYGLQMKLDPPQQRAFVFHHNTAGPSYNGYCLTDPSFFYLDADKKFQTGYFLICRRGERVGRGSEMGSGI